jgi:hypothetical protein
MLTNVTLTIENATKMLIALMMLDHTAAHVTPAGIPLMVVQLALMLMNVHSLETMQSATMPPAKMLMDHLNVLASLATLVLHAMITMNAKMVPTIAMSMHRVPIPTVASHALATKATKEAVMFVKTSMSALPNMPTKTSVDQILIARIPLQVITANAQMAMLVFPPTKKTAVKTLTSVLPTVTITATPGPRVPMKYHFTAVNVTSQVTTEMVSNASMLMNVMPLLVVTTAPFMPTVSVIILTAGISALVLMVTTQLTMMTPSVLTSTNVLMVHITAMLTLLAPTSMVVSNAPVKKVSLVKDTTLTSKWVVLISTNVQ